MLLCKLTLRCYCPLQDTGMVLSGAVRCCAILLISSVVYTHSLRSSTAQHTGGKPFAHTKPGDVVLGVTFWVIINNYSPKWRWIAFDGPRSRNQSNRAKCTIHLCRIYYSTICSLPVDCLTLSLPRVINSCSLTRNIASHGMKNLAFHNLYSDERWLCYQFLLSTSLIHFSWKDWENVL